VTTEKKIRDKIKFIDKKTYLFEFYM